MIKLSERKVVLRDETERVFKENVDRLELSEDGVHNVEDHKYYFCDCGSMLRTVADIIGRCTHCGRRVCQQCLGGLCEGGLVCRACCPVKSREIQENEARFYCFSCRAKRGLSRAISFVSGRMGKASLPTARR
jgi:hypothetical protein